MVVTEGESFRLAEATRGKGGCHSRGKGTAQIRWPSMRSFDGHLCAGIVAAGAQLLNGH
jgi:hypothetical protein